MVTEITLNLLLEKIQTMELIKFTLRWNLEVHERGRRIKDKEKYVPEVVQFIESLGRKKWMCVRCIF